MKKHFSELVKNAEGRIVLQAFYKANSDLEFTFKRMYSVDTTAVDTTEGTIRIPNELKKAESKEFRLLMDKVLHQYQGLRNNQNWDIALSDFDIQGNKITAVDRAGKNVIIDGLSFLKMITRDFRKSGELSELDFRKIRERFAENTDFSVEVLTGSAIGLVYSEAGIHSCMNKKPLSYFQIYADNPEVFELIIVKHQGYVMGRMMRVKGDKFNHYGGQYLMGTDLHKDLARGIFNNIIAEDPRKPQGLANDLVKLNYRVDSYSNLPWFDTMYKTDGSEVISNHKGFYELQKTDGRSIEDWDEAVCDLCGYSVHEDEIYYISRGSQEGCRSCGDCAVVINFGEGEGEIVAIDEAYYSNANEGWCLA